MPTEPSCFVLKRDRDVAVVELTDARIIDAFHIEKVSKQLYGLIDPQGHRKIVLNLSMIDMLTSDILAVFVTMRHKLQDQGGKLVFAGAAPRLTGVFQAANLQGLFEFFEDIPAAVRSLTESA